MATMEEYQKAKEDVVVAIMRLNRALADFNATKKRNRDIKLEILGAPSLSATKIQATFTHTVGMDE